MNTQRLYVLLCLFTPLFSSSYISAASSNQPDLNPSTILFSEEASDDLALPMIIEGLCAIAESPDECAEKREYIRVLKPAAEQAFNDFVLFACAVAHAKDRSAPSTKINKLLTSIQQVYKRLLAKLEDLDIEDDEALRAKYLIATEPSFINAAEKIGFGNFKDWYLKEGYQELLLHAQKIRQTIIVEAQRYPTATNYNRYYAFERLYRASIQYSIIKDVLKLNPPIVENTRRQTAAEFSWFYMFTITRKA